MVVEISFLFMIQIISAPDPYPQNNFGSTGSCGSATLSKLIEFLGNKASND